MNTTSQTPPNIATAFMLGVLGVALFAGTLPFTRLAIVDFSPWFITFCRALIGAIPAVIWLIATGKKFRHPKNLEIFISGAILIFGFPGFMAIAMTTIPASHGGVVLGIAPLATAFISVLIAGERHSLWFWLLSIAGAAIVIAFSFIKSGTGIGGLSSGYLWMLAAAIAASTGYVMAGKLARSMSGTQVICRSLFLNLPLIAAGTFWLWQPEFAAPSTSGIIAMLYLGLFSMFIGFFAWNTALAMGGIGRIGQVQLLQIFMTLAISAVLLGEKIDILTIGAAVVVTAIVFLARRV
ncbi:MAG: DMT family transporter [Rhizobiaceae bacterium]|nr:DMT family transporter [Rhizobiaceae bacterium]